jgi:hypothetical protein
VLITYISCKDTFWCMPLGHGCHDTKRTCLRHTSPQQPMTSFVALYSSPQIQQWANNIFQSRWWPAPTTAGQVGGHEGVGKVVTLGPGTETLNVKIGDCVGIKWIAAVCGNCIPCLNKHVHTSSCPPSDRESPLARRCRCLLYPRQDLRILYTRYFPVIRTRVIHIYHTYPGRVGQRYGSTIALRRCNSIFCLEKSRASPGKWVVIPGSGGRSRTSGTNR